MDATARSAVTTLPPVVESGVSFRALGTYVELRVADTGRTDEVGALALDVLAEVDATCSRFRDDSDLMHANRRAGRWTAVSEVLIGMLDALDESDDREPGADGAEPGEDDEASAQAPVTPGSTRPTLPLPVMVRA